MRQHSDQLRRPQTSQALTSRGMEGIVRALRNHTPIVTWNKYAAIDGASRSYADQYKN